MIKKICTKPSIESVLLLFLGWIRRSNIFVMPFRYRNVMQQLHSTIVAISFFHSPVLCEKTHIQMENVFQLLFYLPPKGVHTPICRHRILSGWCRSNASLISGTMLENLQICTFSRSSAINGQCQHPSLRLCNQFLRFCAPSWSRQCMYTFRSLP